MRTLFDVLAARARDAASPALVDDGTGDAMTGVALAARVRRRAGALRRAGVRAGDRVAVLLGNSLACAETLLAVPALGAAVVPLNTRLAPPEIDARLADAEPALLVASADRRDQLAGLAHLPPVVEPDLAGDDAIDAAPRPDDAAVILYTSGTTGRAKGAVLTHANLVWNAERIAEWLALGPADRVFTTMPLFHVNAIVVGLLAPLVAGGAAIIADRFRAERFWTSVARHRATTGGTVPTMLARLLADTEPDPAATASLRFLATGSAPVPGDLLLAFERRFGVPVIEGYGLTECTCRATFNPIDGRRRPGSVGLPLAPLRVVDADGRDVPPGAVGEIVLRGPHVMQGYFRNPDATARTLRDGWLHTNDLGWIDADGFVHVAGRVSELIIRGGENVYPREVEEVLLAHPGVAEAAVVGLPDPTYGEVVAAVVVARPGTAIETDALADWCGARLADFKRPARIRVVPELPLPRDAPGRRASRRARRTVPLLVRPVRLLVHGHVLGGVEVVVPALQVPGGRLLAPVLLERGDDPVVEVDQVLGVDLGHEDHEPELPADDRPVDLPLELRQLLLERRDEAFVHDPRVLGVAARLDHVRHDDVQLALGHRPFSFRRRAGQARRFVTRRCGLGRALPPRQRSRTHCTRRCGHGSSREKRPGR